MNNVVRLIFAVVGFFLAGCVHNNPRQMTALSPPTPLLELAGKKAFDSADKWSFTQAVFNYATGSTDQYHKVPVGDYLLAGLASRADVKGDITEIRLLRFETSGRMAFGLVGRNIVTMRVEIGYKRKGEEKLFAFNFEDRDIGALLSGEGSAIPLTSAGPLPDKLQHDQIRPILTELLHSFEKAIDGP